MYPNSLVKMPANEPIKSATSAATADTKQYVFNIKLQSADSTKLTDCIHVLGDINDETKLSDVRKLLTKDKKLDSGK
jgi:hypothetical protein